MVIGDNKTMGAFPFNKKGRKKAVDYMRKLKKESDGKFSITEG